MLKRRYFIRFDLNDKNDNTYGSKKYYIKKNRVLDKFELGNLKFFVWFYKKKGLYQVIERSTGLVTVQSKISSKRAVRKFYRHFSRNTIKDLENMKKKALSYYGEMLEQINYGRNLIKNGTMEDDKKKERNFNRRF